MIKSVYTYIILFVTLMMVIGGSVGVFMSLADIVAPNTYTTSYDEYKYNVPMGEDGKTPTLTEAEIQANYEARIKTERQNTISNAKNTLIKSLGWIIIPLPLFIYFQRLVNRKDKQEAV